MVGKPKQTTQAHTTRVAASPGRLDDLHHILVVKQVVLAHLLRLVLDRRAPHPRKLELLHEAAMDLVAQVGDARLADRGKTVRYFTRLV